MKIKHQKIITILEALTIIILAILLSVFKFIPEYKKTLGSSDRFINQEEYEQIIELKLSTGPNILLITNKENKIANILFQNQSALCLYNQNIENQQLDKSLDLITTILNNNDYLTSSTITIILYNQTSKNIKDTIIEKFITKNNTLNIIEEEHYIDNKEVEKEQLLKFEETSQEVVRKYKNELLKDELFNTLSKEDAKELADNVYEKLIAYSINIKNQEKESPMLPIQLINSSEEKDIYPSNNSWYYIEEGRVYAYINFNSNNYNYDYCYMGEIESVKEGVC